MKGVNLFLLASFLLVTALISSCGEYAEVPYEQRLVDPPGTFTDSRDGKKYKTVEIGTQTWMAKNFDYTTDYSRCYNDSDQNCEIYGRLYNWNEAKKICPWGWRLPSNEDWQTLMAHIGGLGTAGKKLKANSGLWQTNTGTDDYEFHALPAGNCNSNSFENMGVSSNWWSEQHNSGNGWSQNLSGTKDDMLTSSNPKMSFLASVRCVKKPAPNLPSNYIWDLDSLGGMVTTGGIWFRHDDSNDRGSSTTDFDCENESCKWQTRDGKININFVQFNKGDFLAYAGVAFSWRLDESTAPEVWGNHTGLCVEYALESNDEFKKGNGEFIMQIDAGSTFAYDHYKISLPPKEEVGTALFKFEDFKQEGWGTATTLDNAKKYSKGIQFQGKHSSETRINGATATLTLRSVRWDSCD